MPEDLRMEVCDSVEEAMIKAIPKKKKCEKTKWLLEEALQIAEKRREAKGKGEEKRYISKNSKEWYESLPQWSMQRNRGKL